MTGFLMSHTKDKIQWYIDRTDFSPVDEISAPEVLKKEFQRYIQQCVEKGFDKKDVEMALLKEFMFPEKGKEVPETSSTQTEKTTPTEQTDTDNKPNPEKPQLPEPKPRKPDKNKKKRRRKGRGNRKGPRKKATGGRRKGIGNRTVKDFPEAVKIPIQMSEDAMPQSECPCCKDSRLHALRPLEKIYFKGGQLILPVILMISRSRCNSCGQVYSGELPVSYQPEVAVCSATPEAAALSILLRFGLGFPDLRLDRLQEWQQAPFDNSRQGRITSEVFERLFFIREALDYALKNASLRVVDDCSVRIIESLLQIREEQGNAEEAGFSTDLVRSGINITTYMAEFEGMSFTVFMAGRQHQGEQEYELQKKRISDSPVYRVADAATKSDCLYPFPDLNEFGFRPRKSGSNSQKSKIEPVVDVDETGACLQHLRDIEPVT